MKRLLISSLSTTSICIWVSHVQLLSPEGQLYIFRVIENVIRLQRGRLYWDSQAGEGCEGAVCGCTATP
jgi:hypothetical protein